ncbi:MAG: sulfatase-like hydrolase/transferase [Oscillospiraceae bacterium]|nr:sulfatase-like hydrolase/transferase [Oscillospiraceae bacterium]
MGNVLLISKDVLMKSYLSPYGQKEFDMPNVKELAEKGTVFHRHYTAAPSTAMAFTSMFTEKYAYQTDRKKYVEVEEYEGVTLFDRYHELGYECHVLWDSSYVYLAQKYSKCYGKHTTIHSVDWLTKAPPAHIVGKFDDLTYFPEYTEKLRKEFKKFLNEIVGGKKKVFLWIHFPHVLAGRNSYGSDMDVYDELLGYCREYFTDENIFLTADHGHMNGTHGKYGYGFDVYEPAICIPLIAPKLEGMDEVTFPTSNTQLADMIFNRKVAKLPYVISETAYYEQPHREIAIIKDNYKYVYEKATGKCRLHDLNWDPEENVDLSKPEIYDLDRRRYYSISQRVYYQKWDDAQKALAELETVKQALWRAPVWYKDLYYKMLFHMKIFAAKILNK